MRLTIRILSLGLVAFLFSANPTLAFAQEDEKGATLTDEEKKAAAEKRRAELRKRFGPNIAKAVFGEAEVSIMGGRQKAEGADAQSIDSLKAGELFLMTEGVALKLKTATDLKFGDVLVKYGNAAPNYPGVYSVWLKKTDSGWKASFNEKADMWGTQYDPKKDIGEVAISYRTLDEPAETLTFKVEKKDAKQGVIRISLSKHEWSLPFAVAE